jgi:Fe-S-cluster containining protein
MTIQETEAPRTRCIRCGTCCKKGGPALHKEDASLFKNGVLDRTDVYTIRKGEMARNLEDKITILKQEIIKIKGKGTTWTCMFFDEKNNACAIYQRRPIECKALKCWDTQYFTDIMNRPYLHRRELVNANDGILKIMDAHEKRCSYEDLGSVIKKLEGPSSDKAAEKIIELVKYDDFMRPFLSNKLNLHPNMMDFFFGRPLTITIAMFGLAIKEKGGTVYLVPKKPENQQ